MERQRSGGAVPTRLQAVRSAIRLVAATCCLTVALVASTALSAGAVNPTAPDNTFTLSADAEGLFPGANLTVALTAHNPQEYALVVKAAEVTVGDATPPCSAANVSAQSFAGDVTVPAHGSAIIPVRMQMAKAAPDSCQGVTFPLLLDATAEPLGAQPSAGGFAFTGANSAVLLEVGALAFMSGLIVVCVRRRSVSAAP